MSTQFKKIAGFGLWKRKGEDGSIYYSGKCKLMLTEFDDKPEQELYVSLSQSEKRQDTSPDLWVTLKVKEDEDNDDGFGRNQQPPPEKDEDETPF